MEEKLTVKQVAKYYGVKERQVLYAVRRGILQAEKMGWIWIFDRGKLPQRFPVRRQHLRKSR
ncbi:MAG: hypothetical protein WDA47_07585 [Bacilli bacterium]